MNVETIKKDLTSIRNTSPVVHNITNFVVMEITANALLALGASPIMAHAIEEVADIVQIARALVLNIGTLETKWIQSMHEAALAANALAIPIILDPVGAGATTFRTNTALNLIESTSPKIIRGNAAEILALAGITIQSKGVDSNYTTNVAYEAAVMLAQKYSSTVIVSGVKDLIVKGKSEVYVENGSALMSKVTGMGCTASALLGAFCAINNDTLLAATHATAVMGIAGEIAATLSSSPGSFKVNFIDTLYNLTPELVAEKMKVVSK